MDSLMSKILGNLILKKDSNYEEIVTGVASILKDIIDAQTIKDYDNIRNQVIDFLEHILNVKLHKVNIKTKTRRQKMSKKISTTNKKNKTIYLYGLKIPTIGKDSLQKLIEIEESESRIELEQLIIEYVKKLAEVNKLPKPFNYITAKYLLAKVVQYILSSAIDVLYIEISQKDKEKLYADKIEILL
jgi:hypothetical protein